MTEDLDELQQQVADWAKRNCTAKPENWAFDHAAIVAEEAGELIRHAVKGRYGFNGTREEWRHKAQEEIGDIIVSALVYADAEDFIASECIRVVLHKLAVRDNNYRKGLWTH